MVRPRDRFKTRQKRSGDEDYGYYYSDTYPDYDLEFDECNNYVTGNNTGCLLDTDEDATDGYNDPQTYFWPDIPPTSTVEGMTLCMCPTPTELPSLDGPMPTCSDCSLAIWDPATERTYCGLDTGSDFFTMSPCQSIIAEKQAVEVPGVETTSKGLPTCAAGGEDEKGEKAGGAVRVGPAGRLLGAGSIGGLLMLLLFIHVMMAM